MKKTISLICVLFVLLVVSCGYVFFCFHGLSAKEKPFAIEAYIAKHLRHLAIPSGVRELKNPLTETPLLRAEARDHFADHCAACHGNLGDGKTMLGEGLYPPPPDLRDAQTQKLTDGEIFYIIKNGIRFTGMPGFGGEDNENWALVLFIRHLQNLSPAELKLMQDQNQLK